MDLISGKHEYLALGSLERLRDQKVFYSSLDLRIFLLQLFPPISRLIRYSRSTVDLSLLTPLLSQSLRFRETALHSQKKLQRIQEIV
jgi:hypothetical protein